MTTRRALAIRHVAFEDVGIWRETLAERGFSLDYVDVGAGNWPHEALIEADVLIVLGAPIGVYETEAYPFLVEEIATIRRRLDAQKPIVGICLGAQLMAAALGARVASGPAKEIGHAPIELTEAGRASPLAALDGLPVLHWHGDNLELPAGAERLASTAHCTNQAFRIGAQALGLQFHVEADPERIESWLVGHAFELGHAGVDPRRVRADAARYGAATARAGRALLADWLQGLSL